MSLSLSESDGHYVVGRPRADDVDIGGLIPLGPGICVLTTAFGSMPRMTSLSTPPESPRLVKYRTGINIVEPRNRE